MNEITAHFGLAGNWEDCVTENLKKIVSDPRMTNRLIQILMLLEKEPMVIPEDLFSVLYDNNLFDFDTQRITHKGRAFIAENSNLKNNTYQ